VGGIPLLMRLPHKESHAMIIENSKPIDEMDAQDVLDALQNIQKLLDHAEDGVEADRLWARRVRLMTRLYHLDGLYMWRVFDGVKYRGYLREATRPIHDYAVHECPVMEETILLGRGTSCPFQKHGCNHMA
jgi:CBS-domain-containing membrane protein